MLAEFVRSLVDLGASKAPVQFHQHPEIRDRAWLQHGGRDLVEVRIPGAPVYVRLTGWDDLVQFAMDQNLCDDPEVYIAEGQITVLCNREDRRQRGVVRLFESRRFVLCQGYERDGLAMQPREAVRFLRYSLHSANTGDLAKKLGRIDFTRSSSGRSHVDHGKESFGKAVEAAVQQADDIPDRFVTTVPLWTNPGFSRFSAQIEWGLFLDLDAQNVHLQVLSDECARVMAQVQLAVASELREKLDGVPVFMGQPADGYATEYAAPEVAYHRPAGTVAMASRR